MDIVVKLYEEWMRPQVAYLFSRQYGVSESAFAELISTFYEHPYQKEKCIRIVATEGDKVVGFQSLFYWPYCFNGKQIGSFQSGNSLVHEEYRGRGIFAQLLNYVDEKRKELGVELLMGFPTEQSRGSFLRNGWKNILDLQWYVRPVSTLAPLFKNENRLFRRKLGTEKITLSAQAEDTQIRLSADPEFRSWRMNYADADSHFGYENDTAYFSLKTSRRKKILRELVIGDVRTSETDPAKLLQAFRDLSRSVRKTGGAHFLSIAVNPADPLYSPSFLESAGFRPINKKIYFIIKNFNSDLLPEDPGRWRLFRSDIDTW